MKRNWQTGVILLMIAASVTGCSGAGKPKGEAAAQTPAASQTPEDTTPVTLSIYMTQTMTDDEFQELLLGPVQKKYPYISIEKVNAKNIDEILASGNIPDLVTIWNAQFLPYQSYGMLQDITPLLTKYKIDLNRFEPSIIDASRVGQNKNEIYGLPYFAQINCLYYNKDIFDKFGVSYPKDGMTWDDAIDLAKKVSRSEGGVQYRGLDYDGYIRLGLPLSVNFVDPVTLKANVNSDTWRKAFQLGKQILAIPNNKPDKLETGQLDAFFKDKTVAMYGSVNRISSLKSYMDNGLNVGIAQYPSYKERPNTYEQVDAHYMFITKQSQHKDAAIKVLQSLTTDEVQTLAMRKFGRVTPLQNPDIKKQFAADMPWLKDVGLQSIFKSKFAPGLILPIVYNQASSVMKDEYVKYVQDQEDLNTALKNAEEGINKLVEASQSK